MTTLRKGTLRLAFQNIALTKGRSFLTMLGIIIGVAAVIVVVSIGEGVKQQIGGQMARYGKDVLMIRSDAGAQNPLSGLGGSTIHSISASDIDIVRHAPGAAKVAPLGSVVGAVSADHSVDNPVVIATTGDFQTITNHKIAYGGFFDTVPDSHTAILGRDIALALFDDSVPLAQTFTFRGQEFMVAGIYDHFAAPPLSLEADYNNAIFIPYTTARTLLGSDPAVYRVLVKTAPDTSVATLSNDITNRLLSAHGGAHDIVVDSMHSTRSNSESTLSLLTMMTIGVAIIALLVGGVGIMNVMLVSITERLQEVGLRKAVGATNQQILRQFLAEAFVLSAIGALIGVILALSTIGLLRLYTNLQPVPVWPYVIGVPLAAIFTGVFFGTFPAAQAARKDPIEALRRL